MTAKPFDPKKPYMTRAGHKARILGEFSRRGIRRLAVVVEISGNEILTERNIDGTSTPVSNYYGDLINVPEVTTKVAYTYRNSKGDVWCKFVGCDRKDSADNSSSYLGYVEWTFEDGEPVSCRFVKEDV